MKLLLLLLSALISTSFAADIDLQMMHTKPVCNHPGKTTAWCTYDDLIAVSEASGMIEKINAQIDLAVDPAKAKISVAYFSFSNKLVFRKLCERAKAGVPIDFFLDSSYRENTLNQELIHGVCTKDEKVAYEAALAAGQTWPALPNVKFHFIGQKDTTIEPIIWRLHHNKFLMVDSGEGDSVQINFSSGNLSAYGTSLHFDHWVTAKVSRASNLYNTHRCVVQAMKVAVDPDQDGTDDLVDDPEKYRQELDRCLTSIQALTPAQAIAQERIAPFFSPNPQNAIAKALVKEIGEVPAGQKITGAIQHFTHSSIADALVKACQRGVTVQMLMDDDVISGESEVPGVAAFYNSKLKNTCIDIRFMQTNAEGLQMMHNKFLILGTQRVFAGAGHFTYSAMTSNYENFYLMEDAGIHKQYSDLFQFMHDASIEEAQIPLVPDAPEEPAPTPG